MFNKINIDRIRLSIINLDKKNIVFFSIFLFLFSFAFHYFYFIVAYDLWISKFNNTEFYFITGKDAYYYASGLKDLINPNYFTPFSGLTKNFFVNFLNFFHLFLGLSFNQIIIYIPMILGSLIAPLFFILALVLLKIDDLIKNNIKLNNFLFLFIISILASIYPIVLRRTFAGWTDTDIVILPGLLLHFILLSQVFLVLKNKIQDFYNDKEKNILNIILILFFLFLLDIFLIKLYLNNLICIVFSIVLLLFYLSFQLIKICKQNKNSNCNFIKLNIFLFSNLLWFILLFEGEESKIFLRFLFFVIIYNVVFLLLFNKKTKIFIYILFLLGVITFLLSPSFNFIYNRIYSYLFLSSVTSKTLTEQIVSFYNPKNDISELKPVSIFEFVFVIFGVPFLGPLLLIGYFVFLLKRKLSFYIILPLFFIGITIFISGNRFLIYLIIPFLYAFIYLFLYSKKICNHNEFKKIINILFYIILFIYLIFILLGNYKVSKIIAKKTIKNTEISNVILKKIKEKETKFIKKPEYIFSWWEYGYQTSFYSGILTAPNNGNQNIVLKYLMSLALNEKRITIRQCITNVMYLYINYIKDSIVLKENKDKIFLYKNLLRCFDKCLKKTNKENCYNYNWPYIFIDYISDKDKRNIRDYLINTKWSKEIKRKID